MTAVKVIKIIGTSDESWQDAAENAYEKADETIDDLQGVKVESWTADVGDDGLTNYKATVEMSFPIRE